MAPGKFFSIEYDHLGEGRLNLNQSSGTADPIMEGNRRTSLKLRLPLVMRERVTLLTSLGFQEERFQFEEDSPPQDLPFVNQLPGREFRRAELGCLGLVSTNKRRYYTFRTKFSLQGDFHQREAALSEFARVSFTGLVGWNPTPELSWGIGAYYSYGFGRHSVYPLLMYNRTFNSRWGIEAALPAQARVRWSPNEKTFFYSGAKVKSARYLTTLPGQNAQESGFRELNWTEIRVGFSVEREIYDFLWIGLDAGYRQSLGLELRERFSAGGQPLVEAMPSNGMYLTGGIFFVVPKRFRK